MGEIVADDWVARLVSVLAALRVALKVYVQVVLKGALKEV